MQPPVTGRPVLRFGVFEVDLQARELHKSGLKVRIQEQPFQILALLLERRGAVLSRDELQKILWPDGTFVDFEHGLNSAVKKLREALEDDADNPRFIETVPRRGYKFIWPVDGALQPSALPVGHVDAKGARRWLLLGTVILVILVSAAVGWWLLSRLMPKITGSTQLTFGGRALGPVPLFGEGFLALATDGNRIYYSTLKAGGVGPAYVSVGGRDQVLMATPFQYAEVRHISPDGSVLLVYGTIAGALESHLWLVPTAGGGPRRLGSVEGHDGAWSPDGRQIVYAKGQDLYRAESDGSNSRKLTTIPGKAFWIRWAPDATRIRFTVIDPKTSAHRLWESQPDGTDLHRLSLSWDKQPQECCGEWTPDGRFFLFRIFRDSRADIWLIREGRWPFSRGPRKPIRLTTGPLDTPAAIPSRDGKKLFAIETLPKFELQRYDLKTRRLAPFLPGISAVMADFSPDHQWIAYVEQRGKETILWRSKVDGSERLQLTAPPMFADDPRWSPDGKQIVFMGKLPDAPWNNYVVPAGGGGPGAFSPEERNALDATWSPDGTSVMFGRPPDYWAEASTPKAIYILNLKTNQITTLPGSEGLFSPRWSPDGRYVAAMPLIQQKLMLFDFATQSWMELASHCTDNPVWSRDSAYVYFNGCNNVVMRVRRVSRKLEEVLDLKIADPNAWGCGLANTTWDGALLIRCAVHNSDIYALDVELP